ncbi:MAG: hypothetical protein J5829_03150 [Lachnospiraceae bacterium]|nr:hypothetical protein [Lachnospiraceae bacterium]
MGVIVVAIAALVMILLLIRGIYDEVAGKKKLREKLKNSFGKKTERSLSAEEFDTLTHFHRNNLHHRKGCQIIDDITWNDLDMDEVFLSMDSTLSQTGKEVLYDILRRPVKDEEVIKRRDRIISFFSENETERLACQICFAKMGRLSKISVSDYLNDLEGVSGDNNFRHILCILFAIAALIMVFVRPVIGFPVFFVVLIYNVATYFRRKGDIEPYIVSFAYITRMIRSSRELVKIKCSETAEYTKRIDELSNGLRGLNINTFILFSGRGMTGGFLDMVLDYLRIFFHLDLIKFNIMLAIVRDKHDDIRELFELTGFLDASIAVASYRKSIDHFCVPEYCPQIKVEAKKLFHPLLQEPVPSDVSTEKGIIVTGSNASGKSTFLKSVALATLMSQTIATVAAERFISPMFEIYSSMSIRDNIIAGESYYMAEIKSLKRILDRADSAQEPMICFIDEVLRGTNTIERIAASSQILKSLSRDNVLLFAATHDYELTYMLEDYFENYHFSEEVRENDIDFSYILEEGRAQSKNAILLLKLLGYNDSITDSARESARVFQRENKWEKL